MHEGQKRTCCFLACKPVLRFSEMIELSVLPFLQKWTLFDVLAEANIFPAGGRKPFSSLTKCLAAACDPVSLFEQSLDVRGQRSRFIKCWSACAVHLQRTQRPRDDTFIHHRRPLEPGVTAQIQAHTHGQLLFSFPLRTQSALGSLERADTLLWSGHCMRLRQNDRNTTESWRTTHRHLNQNDRKSKS